MASKLLCLYLPENACFSCLEEQIKNFSKFLNGHPSIQAIVLTSTPYYRNFYSLLKKYDSNIEIYYQSKRMFCDSQFDISNPIWLLINSNLSIDLALSPVRYDTALTASMYNEIKKKFDK
jgi:hypothetical protein